MDEMSNKRLDFLSFIDGLAAVEARKCLFQTFNDILSNKN